MDRFAVTNLATLRLTMIGSFLDSPGVALPTGVDDDGLPTSMLLSLPRGEDDRLLRIAEALTGLFSQRQRGEVPPFRRVLVETTGLADPAPIMSTLFGDPVLRHHYKLGLIITVVDCVNANLQRSSQPEWLAQVAAADRLLVSKSDWHLAFGCRCS
jgi:hypothetical protein